MSLCLPCVRLHVHWHVYMRHLKNSSPHHAPSVSLDYFFVFFCQCCFRKRGRKSTPPVGVPVPLLLRSLLLPLVVCEACRSSAQHQRAASGLRWNAKHRVNPAFMLPVSFDKVLSELTYGNLVMMCLHTVISSAFHPYFLGLTIVPIMSAIVNALHSLSCSTNRHMVV